MKRYLVLLFLYLPTTVRSQTNHVLKQELDSMFVLDQKYRAYLSRNPEDAQLTDSLMAAFNIKENLDNTLWTYQQHIDSTNLARIESIISTYGYPGTSLVGKPTNETAWSVIQHSSKIKRYFPLIRRAGHSKEVPFCLVAMMHDRLMTEQHKPQLYGTQAACYPLRDTASGNQECFIWPIAHLKDVNRRRKRAGFTTSVEENAKRLHVVYKALTMKELTKTYNLGNSN